MFCRNLFKIAKVTLNRKLVSTPFIELYLTKYSYFSTSSPLKPPKSTIEDELASPAKFSGLKDLENPINIGLDPSLNNSVEETLAYFNKILEGFAVEKGLDSLSNKEDLKLLIYTYYEIGQIHEKLRNISEALDQYIKGKNVIETLGKTDTIEAGNLYNAMGRIYLKQYKFREAGEHLNKAKKVFTKLLASSDVSGQIIRNQYMLGVLHEFEGDLDKAMELFQEIIAEQEKGEILVDEEFNPSLVYQHLGNIYLVKGNIPKARENWDESINRFMDANKKNFEEGLLFCLDLVNNLMRLRQYEEATYYANRCLSVCEQYFSTNDLKLADTIVVIAPIYAQNKDFVKAIQVLQKAANIYSSPKNIKQFHEQASFTYLKMAEINLSRKKEKEAQANVNKAIEVTVQVLGENSPQVGHHYTFWGDLVRDKTNNSDIAKAAYKSALETYKKTGSGHEIRVITTYYKLGVLLFDGDALEESLENFQEGLKLSLENNITPLKMLQEMYDYIGSIYFRLERYKEGVPYFLKAGEAWCEVGDAEAFNYVDEYYQNLGKAYEDYGHPEEAVEFYKRALEMAVKNRGDQKEAIQSYIKSVLKLLNKLQKHEESEKLKKMYGFGVI